MTYSVLYYAIINKHGSIDKPKSMYTERHHIVPKSLGGSNDAGNLIYITARVHYICHKLLCKIYPNNAALRFAFWAMCNQLSGDVQRKYKVSSIDYDKAKKAFAGVNSARHKGKRMSTAWCENLRNRMLGNTFNVKGKDNPLFGKPRSMEVKEKIRKTKALFPERNAAFKGYWVTPYGKFISTKLAADNHPTINNGTSIANYCHNGDKIVTKIMTRKGPFKLQDIGKSLRSLGWDFVPSA